MTQTDWQEPFTRFGTLFEEAKRAIPQDPNAMSLATVDANGRPSVRVVLLKDFDTKGFVFYTNHLSAKGKALDATRLAAINFYWPALFQQVRVEGTVEQVSTAEADAYFATRPRVSQLGAWASEQSQPLDLTRGAGGAVDGAHREVRGPARAAASALGRISAQARAHRVLEGARVQAALARGVREGGRGLAAQLAQPLEKGSPLLTTSRWSRRPTSSRRRSSTRTTSSRMNSTSSTNSTAAPSRARSCW